MRDMFYNYDHNIEKDVCPIHPLPVEFPEVLASAENISIVNDAKGNEIGVRVKKGMPFTLYFYLDDFYTGRSITHDYETCEEVLKSNTIFTVFSGKHKEIFTISYPTREIFDLNLSELCINVPMTSLLKSENENEEPKLIECASLLTSDTYRISLSLEFDDGSYKLFSESDGLLIVR